MSEQIIPIQRYEADSDGFSSLKRDEEVNVHHDFENSNNVGEVYAPPPGRVTASSRDL